MPQSHRKAAPAYRLHKSSGLGIVSLFDVATGKRKDFTLGEYDTAESRAKYAALLAKWEAAGRRLDDPNAPPAPINLSVNQALLRYVDDVERKCRRTDGTPTGTIFDIKITVGYLSELFGTLPLSEFGADQLERLRDELIRDGRVVPQINKRVSQARQWYVWCLGRRLVPPGVDAYRVLLEMKQRCRAISAGEYGAKPGKRVEPADPKAVDAAIPHLPPAPKAIVQILRLTGARPSEILDMKPGELDRSGETWILRPTWHKSAKKGKSRLIYFGPEAQAALAPWLLGTGPDEYIFTPAKSEERRFEGTPRDPRYSILAKPRRGAGTKTSRGREATAG